MTHLKDYSMFIAETHCVMMCMIECLKEDFPQAF